MDSIQDIRKLLDDLENNYNEIQNADRRINEKKMVVNGSEELISDIIISESVKMKGIFPAPSSSINTVSELKSYVFSYRDSFNTNKNHIEDLQKQIDKLNQEKDDLTDYKDIRKLYTFLEKYKNDFIRLSLKNNPDVINIFKSILNNFNGLINIDTYNGLVNVINKSISNRYNNFDYLISVFKKINENVSDIFKQMDIENYINELEKLKNIVKVDDVVEKIRLFDSSLKIDDIINRYGFDLVKDIDINIFINKLQEDINSKNNNYSGIDTSEYGLINEINNKQSEIDAKNSDINTTLTTMGVYGVSGIPFKENDINTLINEIDDLSKLEAKDQEIIHDNKISCQNIIKKLGDKQPDLVKTLIEDRKKKIDELEETILDPSKYANFLTQKGISITGLSPDDINKLAIKTYIESLNTIYTDTISSYVKFQYQIPLYIDKYDSNKNHTSSELQDITELTQFSFNLDLFLNKIISDVKNSVQSIRDNNSNEYTKNICKSQNLQSKIDDLENKLVNNSNKNFKGKINFFFISLRLKNMKKNRESLKIMRQSRIINAYLSTIYSKDLRSYSLAANSLIGLKRNENAKRMREIFSKDIGEVEQLLGYESLLGDDENNSYKIK